MSYSIVCVAGKNIIIVDNKGEHKLSSAFIKQYCSNHEKIVQKNAWKTEGFNARFRNEDSGHDQDFTNQLLDNAKVTGLAMDKEGELIYCASVGTSSGIFRKPLHDDNADSEGHIFHDCGMIIQDVAVRSDGQMAFSIYSSNGHNIAVAPKNSAHYKEVTEGDSIDRNPCWNPSNSDELYFDSAPVAYDQQGKLMTQSRGIMRLNLKDSTLEEMVADDDFDFICPQIDLHGNIYCIRRPFSIKKFNGNLLTDIIMMPFRLTKAIFRAIEHFSIKNTGQPLISSGANPAKSRFAPQEQYFEGYKINAEESLRRSLKSGDQFPGFIPGNWELVKIAPDKSMTRIEKSVCCFALTPDDTIIYSNGRYLLSHGNDKKTKIAEVNFPTKVIVTQ